MALDRALAERYEALFWGYGAGGDPHVVTIKGRIAELSAILRPDAMYFLLVNFDHMVIRALSGYVPGPPRGGELPGAPLDSFVSPDEIDGMVSNAFRILLDDLARRRRSGEQSSANDVIRALSVTTQEIANSILWWREDG